MTADQFVERLIEIDRPEYELVIEIAPHVCVTPDWLPSRIIDVRRCNDYGGTIEVVVE